MSTEGVFLFHYDYVCVCMYLDTQLHGDVADQQLGVSPRLSCLLSGNVYMTVQAAMPTRLVATATMEPTAESRAIWPAMAFHMLGLRVFCGRWAVLSVRWEDSSWQVTPCSRRTSSRSGR